MYREPARATSSSNPPETEVVIESPLSPSAFLDGLGAEVLDGRSSLRAHFDSHHDFIGWLDLDDVRVKRRQRFHNNSFAPVFRGRLEPCGDGSRLVGTFGLHRGVVVVFYLMAGVGFLMAAVALGGLVGGDAGWDLIPFLLLGLAMGLVTPRLRRVQFPRSDREAIEAMLRRVASPIIADRAL